MRKSLWAIALLFVSLTAANVSSAAADDSGALQDQVFVQALAQQEQAQAPEAPALGNCQEPVAAAVFCSGIQCFQDSDCWTWCPGGVGASYCNRGTRACWPY